MPLIEHRYGVKVQRKLSDPEVELFCFLNDWTPEQGGLGKAGHFKRFVQMVWGPNSNKHFIWHPWAEKMLEEACKWQYLGVIGAGNSGKTDFFSVWALVNWLAARYTTKVLVTSTSLKESKKRIWGAIREYYMAAGCLPGKLVDSLGQIRSGGSDDPKVSDRSGVELIAGEKKKEKDTIGKLIGMKNQRIILIADELPELSEALLTASFSNLALNPYFQMVGIGNFDSLYDPLGVFCQPKEGYNSITDEDTEWETERGFCIRFDGLKSPNVLSGRDDYPFIYNNRDLREHQRTLGVNTKQFWRMCRSFPCPEGEDNTVFTEADLLRGRVHDQCQWLEPPTAIAAIDPGFTTGGDKSVAIIADWGRRTDTTMTLSIRIVRELEEDLGNKTEPRNYQIARQFAELCKRNNVTPKNAAYDSTGGGGILFGEHMWQLWSQQCLGVNFGGKASTRPVSNTDQRTCDKVYRNRVTELWFSGLEFVRAGMIRGLTLEIARQLKSRRKQDPKLTGSREALETKTDMKKRSGFSPDHADAFVILVELIRTRFGAAPELKDFEGKSYGSTWDRMAGLNDSIYCDTFMEV